MWYKKFLTKSTTKALKDKFWNEKLFSYLIFFVFTSNLSAKDNTMIMKLKYGEVEISLWRYSA